MWTIALKLQSVLLSGVAMRPNSLMSQKKFSIRRRQPYTGKSLSILRLRLSLGGMTAALTTAFLDRFTHH